MARNENDSGDSSTREIFQDQPPDETTILKPESATSGTFYLRAVIGKLDSTLHPMIPAGSIVHIDTEKREVSPTKDSAHQLGRPIYLIKSNDAYRCGWCELDEESQRLTLIPHPLSPASSRSWNLTEIECLGRVVLVTTLPRKSV
jgi:hypothetical protein